MGGVYGLGMTGFGTVSTRGVNKTMAGGVRVSKSSPQKVKKKKLLYNFKQISDQILRAKTSNGARVVAIRARGKVALLQRSVGTGKYDSRELDSAITHARAMVRIAKKRMKHLLAEEKAAKKCEDGGSGIDWEEVLQEASENAQARDESVEISEEELERIMQEFMQEIEMLMEELQASTQEMNGMDDLSEELLTAVSEDMEPEDLEQQKKKHRSDEMKDIVAADMRYLKALFDRLAREKAQAAQAAKAYDDGGVSLELAGVDLSAAVPAMTSAAPPVTSEGSVIDVAV